MSPTPRLAVPSRMTRRLCSVVLVSQVPVLVFAAVGARAIAGVNDTGNATRDLVIVAALATLALVATGLLRTRYGIPVGWLVQLGCLLSALILPIMLVVGALFAALWMTALIQGRKMDDLTAAYQAAQATPGG